MAADTNNTLSNAVLFDGALPDSKKEVRLDRLQNYIARLQAYKQSSGTSLSSLTSSARRSLPPPPFLVFAVVEELVRSVQYADVTYIVPGEADPFCVAAAEAIPVDNGASITIFSDDSDLIVYEACKRTRIVPFRDLEVTQVATATILQGDEYRPARIIELEKATVPSLVKPAFFMSLDHYCSLEKAFRLSADSTLDEREDFQVFAMQFVTTKESRELAEIRSDPVLKKSLSGRDSRVSELVHQSHMHANGESTGPLRVYLPFFSDDPARSTAWNVGAETRLLAYSILLQDQPDLNIQEYRRSGARMSAILLELLDVQESVSRATSLISFLRQGLEATTREHSLKEEDSWRYLVMQHTLTHLHNEGLALPSKDDAAHIVLNREPRKWQLIHLAAQYQAAYYSFRMLQQLLSVQGVHKEAAFTDLHRTLNSLPRISAFFSNAVGSDQRQEQVMWCKAIAPLLATFAGEDQDEAEDHKQTKSRKKAKRTHKKQPADVNLASNPFAMLAD